MKKQYRITTNGERYRIEQHDFLWMWVDITGESIKLASPIELKQRKPPIIIDPDLSYIRAIDKTWNNRDLAATKEVVALLEENDREIAKKSKWKPL